MPRWRVSSCSDSPTMRLARSVDRRPTSPRSDTTACWRSALDLLVARLGDPRRLGLGLAAHLGDDRRTLLTRLLADARGLGAGLASCAWYCSSAAWASAWASSALCMPPSMAAVRSA